MCEWQHGTRQNKSVNQNNRESWRRTPAGGYGIHAATAEADPCAFKHTALRYIGCGIRHLGIMASIRGYIKPVRPPLRIISCLSSPCLAYQDSFPIGRTTRCHHACMDWPGRKYMSCIPIHARRIDHWSWFAGWTAAHTKVGDEQKNQDPSLRHDLVIFMRPRRRSSHRPLISALSKLGNRRSGRRIGRRRWRVRHRWPRRRKRIRRWRCWLRIGVRIISLHVSSLTRDIRFLCSWGNPQLTMCMTPILCLSDRSRPWGESDL
jgi:hypothetical protein